MRQPILFEDATAVRAVTLRSDGFLLDGHRVVSRAHDLPVRDQAFESARVDGSSLDARGAREVFRVMRPGSSIDIVGGTTGDVRRVLRDRGCIEQLDHSWRAPCSFDRGMPVEVAGLPDWSVGRFEHLIGDLPRASSYDVVLKPLRWRTRPHVQAECDFANRRITIQIPVPFEPFEEWVPYRARRIGGKRKPRFEWSWTKLRFERPEELVRFLYLHEYHHWYLREIRQRRGPAEAACDRFALQWYRCPATG